MGAGVSCGLNSLASENGEFGGARKKQPSIVKRHKQSRNKQASLTLQGSVATDEDIFNLLSLDDVDDKEHDIDSLRKVSKNIDQDLWKRIVRTMETMVEEEKTEYVHKLHNELQLFTKTLKLLDKILGIDESNVGKAITFLTKSLKIILNCEHVTLFILDPGSQTLRTHSSASVKIKVQVGQGIAGKVAETGEALNIEDAYKNSLFNKKYDVDTGFKTDTILCVPLNDEEGKIMAVLEGVNCFDGVFNEMHTVNMKLIRAQVCNVIKKCQLAMHKHNHERGTQALFKLFKVLYTDLPMDTLLKRIIDTATELVSCERATFYVYDETKDLLWAQSGHGLDSGKKTITLKGSEGSAGKSLTENVLVNMNKAERRNSTADVWQSKFETQTGYKTRNMMAVPILDGGTKKKLGVLQVMNKKQGEFDFLTDSHFTKFDEKILTDFGSELGRAIGGRILEAAFELRINEKSAESEMIKTQLMEYTMQDHKKKISAKLFGAAALLTTKSGRSFSIGNRGEGGEGAETSGNGDSFKFSRQQVDVWHFDVADLSKSDLNVLVKDLFFHLGLHTKFVCDIGKLEAFIRQVGETYNDVPYHNYNHAVSVLHGVYAFLTLSNFMEKLEKIEVLALFVGALWHDLGHDGFTNGFHIATMSDLAFTYNDLHVQENLHASLCNKLMSKEETKFVTLEADAHKRLRRLIIELIISTDMAEHMHLTTTLRQLESVQWESPAMRNQMMTAVLHAVDVSTPCKPTPQALVQSKKLSEEFKRQVDQELSLGMEPLPFMAPKDEAARAQLEINFIDYIVQPLWENILARFPECKICLQNLEMNRKYYLGQLN